MFHEPIYKHKVLQIQIWLIINILAKTGKHYSCITYPLIIPLEML